MVTQMMTKRELYVKIRDCINKRQKKQPLIEEYYHAVMALAYYSDSIYGKPEYVTLLKEISTIQEKETIKPDKHSPTISIGFNPYRIRTTKSMITDKITQLHQLMQKYNIK